MNINFQGKSKPLNHIWSACVGAGRANEGLRADWQSHLFKAVKHGGFRYLRFHGLLHDDMHVYKIVDGQEVFNFQYVDALFDAMLDQGIRPFVEFGFMPIDLASTERTQFWWKGNISPPNDYAKWANLISKLVEHWTQRYGLEEVKNWYFEVWNEPNLSAFWDGTKEQYFRLYQVSVAAIKAIDDRLRVGGPATSNFVPDARFDGELEDISTHLTLVTEDLDSLEWKGVWIEDFLAFCERKKLPVDFISTHPYPTDFALDGHGEFQGRSRHASSTRDDIEWLKRVIASSAYPDVEIHLTEWSSSPSSRDCSHDYLPAAAYVVKTNLEVSNLIDSLSYWVFTDVFEEVGAGPAAFHGGFGMLNLQGIPKPTFHAYSFLNQLGEHELARSEGTVITRTDNGELRGLFYNYPEDYKGTVPMSVYPDQTVAQTAQSFGSSRSFNVVVEQVTPGAQYVLRTVDRDHGVAVQLWNEMGSPNSPSREQTEQLIAYADQLNERQFTADSNGRLTLDFNIGPWAIALLSEEV
ncbi:GH39 family glycosyl hydrolase [Paenibacillus pabuli]|uniref:GH39 family glycosyl hydrolase n=1 Tax=Paenibacillus pabuli TaxID=1472 RepID=UPI003CE88F55